MSNSINLVSTKNSELERELRVLLAFRIVAFSMLAVVAIVSIGIFIFGATIPLSKIKQDENTTLSGISSFHNKLTSYYLVKDRINNINNLLKTRKDYTKSLNILMSQVTQDMSVNAIIIDNDALSIEVTSSNLIPINTMLDNVFKIGQQNKTINNVALDTLSLNGAKGKYSAVIKVNIL